MASPLVRLLKMAEMISADKEAFKQFCIRFDAYIKRHAHFEPKQDENMPNPWKRNMDYAEYENSPYFGSISEFMEKFPGGIKDWIKWREETKGKRLTMYDDLIPKKAAIDVEDRTRPEEEYEPTEGEKEEAEEVFGDVTREDVLQSNKLIEQILDELLEEGEIEKEEVEEWKRKQPLRLSRASDKAAHYIPEKGDDVKEFEKEEPIYSDSGLENFKSIQEFLKKYRREGQSANDAAFKAVKDMINYWKILLKSKKRRSKKGKK